MTGVLEVLNVGAGDMKFSFDSDDPQEVARAERVVMDMLRRGYLLFVEVRGKLKRVTDFDPKKCEYIIADGATYAPEDAEEIEEPKPQARKAGRKAAAKGTAAKGGKSRKSTRRVKADSSRATAVAPTAGG